MLFGFAFFSHQVGGFLGVWLGGVLFERTGSYDVVWWLAILFGVLSALINLPIVEKPVVADGSGSGLIAVTCAAGQRAPQIRSVSGRNRSCSGHTIGSDRGRGRGEFQSHRDREDRQGADASRSRTSTRRT